jgi:lipoprotein-anchoring transpeptidase ErfK/SrfK
MIETLADTPLRLLVPSVVLPTEDDPVPPAPAGIEGAVARTFNVLQHFAAPRAPRLRLRGTTLEMPEDLATALCLIGLEAPAGGDGPSIETTPAETHLHWGAVATAFERRTDPETFLGGAADAERVLLDEIRTAARQAAQPFVGDALPLLEVRRSAGDVTDLALLGIWLSTPRETATVRGRLDRDTLVVLDEPEVEGHGLRETALSLSLLAIVFSQPASAGLFDRLTAGPTPVVHESQAKTDGTPLAVKSQKLLQPGPKIYPSGLVGQDPDAPRTVVVDVRAQRAYLLVDGKLAFETPVSTGSKGRATPRGSFSITEKIRKGKRSTIYKCAMPYWNRLGESAIGMHTGILPGYPASHGCVRLPDEAARFIFDNAPRGTTVQVVDALPAPPAPTPAAPAEDASLIATAR